MPRVLPLSLLAVLVLASVASAQEEGGSTELAGFWRDVDDESRVLKIEAYRIALRDGEAFEAWLARFQEGRAVVNFFGIEVGWGMTLEEGVLKVAKPGRRSVQKLEFRRLEAEPEAFEPAPMELGDGKRLRKSDVRKIQRELLNRERKDQQARNSNNEAKIQKLDAENAAWLRELLGKAGWIDVDRFGVEAANAAWLLTVHSDDLPLMLAALPEIEKDVKSKDLPDGQNYANLYDRVQQHLGRKQRYGTQIVNDSKGNFVVFSLEDRDKVDAWRNELGLPPLRESLAQQERWTGQPIGFQEGF